MKTIMAVVFYWLVVIISKGDTLCQKNRILHLAGCNAIFYIMKPETDTHLNSAKKIIFFPISWILFIFISFLWFQVGMYSEVSENIHKLEQRSDVMHHTRGYSLPAKEEVKRISNSIWEKNVCTLFFSLPLGIGFGSLMWVYCLISGNSSVKKFLWFFWLVFALGITFYGGWGGPFIRIGVLFFYPFAILGVNQLMKAPVLTQNSLKLFKKYVLFVLIVVMSSLGLLYQFNAINYIFIRDVLKNILPIETGINLYYKYTLYPAYMIRNTSERVPLLIADKTGKISPQLGKGYIPVNSEHADFIIRDAEKGFVVNSANRGFLQFNYSNNQPFHQILNEVNRNENSVNSLNRILSLSIRHLFGISLVLGTGLVFGWIGFFFHSPIKLSVLIIAVFGGVFGFFSGDYSQENYKRVLLPQENLVKCILFCTKNLQLNQKNYNEAKPWLKKMFSEFSRPVQIWILKNAIRYHDSYFEENAINLLTGNDSQLIYKSAEYLGVIRSQKGVDELLKVFNTHPWWYVRSFVYHGLLTHGIL